MMEIVSFALLAVTSIIVVVEPASNIAIFVSLTENFGAEEKRKIVSRAMLFSFAVLAFFALAGNLSARITGAIPTIIHQ